MVYGTLTVLALYKNDSINEASCIATTTRKGGPLPGLKIIYASTIGNTEYVVDRVIDRLRSTYCTSNMTVQRAELSQKEDLLNSDFLILACGTWNVSGNEGQLEEKMHHLLYQRASDLDLGGKPFAIIALGDTRYRYTARASHILLAYLSEYGGKKALPPLVIVDEPDEQHERIDRWTDNLHKALTEAGIK